MAENHRDPLVKNTSEGAITLITICGLLIILCNKNHKIH